MAAFSVEDLTVAQIAALLVGSVLPRPIAWVSTVSANGGCNIALFSFFTVASTDPPALCISIGPPEQPEKAEKDSLRCIRETEEFVVNVATVTVLDQLVATASGYPFETDEFEIAGLTPVPADIVKAPLIGEAPISYECRLHQIVPIGTCTLVLGLIVRAHFRDDCLDAQLRILPENLRPLGRLAGPHFATQFNDVMRVPPTV